MTSHAAIFALGGFFAAGCGGTSVTPIVLPSTASDMSDREEGGSPLSVDLGSAAGNLEMDLAISNSTPNDFAVVPSDGFDQFQTHTLAVVNMYRAQVGAPPLELDPLLSQFALAGSVELSQDHIFHQHFFKNVTLGKNGFGFMAAENQGNPYGWMVDNSDPVKNELSQINDIQAMMFGEGPGGSHYDNMVNPDYTRLGVGLLEVKNQLYLTNDFSD